ncbi:MAG: heavy metal-associated domain-containing protein [Acutalibacteraceae bacterium]|nr:heavy metal-associated domain-containing protein [Acutalibacteraceae bacterium]
MIYKISVLDMHCENCVKRINNALEEAGIKFSVDLAEKTVTVDGCEHCLSTALTELEDLGFTPEKI